MSLSVYPSHPDGAASGLPVLLVHGFTSSAATDWPGWAEALAGIGRSSYTVDLPGHGKSPAPSSADEVATSRIVDELVSVIDGMAGDAVDVVGYSLGARLSWELPGASRKPVRHLVLGGISPGEPFAMVNYQQLKAFVADGASPSDPFTGMMAQMISAPGNDARALALCMEGLASEPFQPSPENAPPVPTLFVAGEADQMAQGIDQLAALTPDARVVRVPGGHLEALASAEFRTAALDFLQR